MANKQVLLFLLLILAGCTHIAQSNRSKVQLSNDAASTISPAVHAVAPAGYSVNMNTNTVTPAEHSRSMDATGSKAAVIVTPAEPVNMNAAILGIKIAAIISPSIYIASLFYTWDPTSWLTFIPAAQSIGSWILYGGIAMYTRKATDKEIQHLKQRMQQAQPKENKNEKENEKAKCPICLECDNQPLYPLPDCSCSYYFHIDCIVEYIKCTPLYNLNCPICRQKMNMQLAQKAV